MNKIIVLEKVNTKFYFRSEMKNKLGHHVVSTAQIVCC